MLYPLIRSVRALSFLPLISGNFRPLLQPHAHGDKDPRQSDDELLAQLKARGISQKAFAEGIGMNPRHLGAIKSSELRHHFFNELGTTKLACLWVIDHLGKPEN